MRKLRLGIALAAVLAVVVPATPSSAQRQELELVISRNTTWTKAESPYVLPQYVVVMPNATLTIEPGVRVETFRLSVQGALVAEGTDAEPIVFTGYDGGTWDGLHFVDYRSYRPASVVSDVIVENANAGIRMEGDAFPVHDTTFTGNVVGLEVDNPDTNLTFTGNEFYSNGTGFSAKTTGVIGVYENDFWDNDVSLLFRAQDPWDCFNDPGVFDVRYNDILRGPDAPWYSFDVHTSPQSSESGLAVLAPDNWWGTTDPDDIEARMTAQGDCCPGSGRVPIEWREPAATPQTATTPPGPTGMPAQEGEIHGDPAWIAEVRKPGHGDCVSRAERITGAVHPALSAPPKRLRVAFYQFTGACRWWNAEKGRLGDPGACGRERWFEVRVRKTSIGGRWHVELPRPLPRGRYTFHVDDWAGPYSVQFRVV